MAAPVTEYVGVKKGDYMVDKPNDRDILSSESLGI